MSVASASSPSTDASRSNAQERQEGANFEGMLLCMHVSDLG